MPAQRSDFLVLAITVLDRVAGLGRCVGRHQEQRQEQLEQRKRVSGGGGPHLSHDTQITMRGGDQNAQAESVTRRFMEPPGAQKSGFHSEPSIGSVAPLWRRHNQGWAPSAGNGQCRPMRRCPEANHERWRGPVLAAGGTVFRPGGHIASRPGPYACNTAFGPGRRLGAPGAPASLAASALLPAGMLALPEKPTGYFCLRQAPRSLPTSAVISAT